MLLIAQLKSNAISYLRIYKHHRWSMLSQKKGNWQFIGSYSRDASVVGMTGHCLSCMLQSSRIPFNNQMTDIYSLFSEFLQLKLTWHSACSVKCTILFWKICLLSWCFSQFSSVAQSCPTLRDPVDHNTPALPVHNQIQEFTQTHVHQVSDAIQPSHPQLFPSPPALNISQHQGFIK